MPCTRPLVLAIALNVGGSSPRPPLHRRAGPSPAPFLAQDGRVDLDTFTGSIDVTAWNQGRVKAKARVEGEGLRGSVQLEAFSGDARLRFASLTGDSHLETFSGDVELTLPADAGFELVGEDDAFGNLNSDFALRTEDGRRISSGGGPRVKVETFSGALRLRKQ